MKPIAFAENAALGFRVRHQTELLAEVQPLLAAIAAARGSPASLAQEIRRARDAGAPWLARFEADDESLCLRQEQLYPAMDPDPIEEMSFAATGRIVVSSLDEGSMPAIASLMRLCAAGCHDRDTLRGRLEPDMRELLDALLGAGVLVSRPLVRRARRGPGLTRLQHAAVEIRSETTTVIVDPHLLSTFTAPGTTMDPAERAAGVDAVLISHSHLDHWDPPSLMMFDERTTFVVPRVPRGSILCDAMGARLRGLGFQRVVELDWYGEPLRIGDVEIHALPFYGEQPTRDEPPRHSELRNWGNTYYVRTPQTSAWFLVDSGTCHLGSMQAVAAHVRDRLGGVDAVLSNLRSFHVGVGVGSPFYIASGAYWLALGKDQVSRFQAMSSQCLTLGPAGVAEVFRIAGARFFLPYAHWWAPPGSPGKNEVELLKALARDADKPLPAVLEWKIGDSLAIRANGPFAIE